MTTTNIPVDMREEYNWYVQSVNALKRYDHEYWDLNAPTISDAEYDKLYIKVQQFEDEYPSFVLPDSPIGKLRDATNGNGRRQVRRRTIMLSTEKANDVEKVKKWMLKTTKALNKLCGATCCANPSLFTIEWKYDGDSCSLVYIDGQLTEASYGKGMDGNDCLQHVLYIPSIPKTINAKGRVEVRGEVVCPFANLSKTGYKTCRSAAGGYLANEVADKRVGELMEFIPYWVDAEDNEPVLAKRFAKFFCDYTNETAKFKGLSFVSVQGGGSVEICGVKHPVDDIHEAIDFYTRTRGELDFPTDGIVIKSYDMDAWPHLGATDHHPKYAIAYKFPAQQVRAIIDHIDYTVGEKTGKITPMAILQPTSINGIVVSKVSLGSEKCMAELGLTYDSRNIPCMLGLANDVIPHIYSAGE